MKKYQYAWFKVSSGNQVSGHMSFPLPAALLGLSSKSSRYVLRRREVTYGEWEDA